MSILTRMKRDLDQILFPSRDRHAIPTMDGPLSPNDLLDGARPHGPALPGADDLCRSADGWHVAAGRQILSITAQGHQSVQQFDAEVTALAAHPDGRLLAGLAGQGLVAIAPDGGRRLYTGAGAELPGAISAIAVAPDGAILLANASRDHAPAEFIRDLMAKGRSGSVIRVEADLSSGRVLAGGLQFPGGLCLDPGGRALWYSEGWSHSISSLALSGGAARKVIANLPGYPGRMVRGGAGVLLCLFAMRTHLTELVLREDAFRQDMVRHIAPEHWIGPALRTTGSYYEPLQAGNVRKLGVQKPWAPPRSYGLVLEVAPDGEILRSFHSRVGGRWHGITAVAEDGADHLLLVSKGAGQVLRLAKGAAA